MLSGRFAVQYLRERGGVAVVSGKFILWLVDVETMSTRYSGNNVTTHERAGSQNSKVPQTKITWVT